MGTKERNLAQLYNYKYYAPRHHNITSLVNSRSMETRQVLKSICSCSSKRLLEDMFESSPAPFEISLHYNWPSLVQGIVSYKIWMKVDHACRDTTWNFEGRGLIYINGHVKIFLMRLWLGNNIFQILNLRKYCRNFYDSTTFQFNNDYIKFL